MWFKTTLKQTNRKMQQGETFHNSPSNTVEKVGHFGIEQIKKTEALFLTWKEFQSQIQMRDKTQGLLWRFVWHCTCRSSFNHHYWWRSGNPWLLKEKKDREDQWHQWTKRRHHEETEERAKKLKRDDFTLCIQWPVSHMGGRGQGQIH